jgi:TIR domain
MPDIFLSYAREDVSIAQRLARALEDEGWSVWWDRHIPAGKTFDEVIQEKVAAARCVVVLWSKTSVESKWVKIEARAGSNRGILIPAALITNMEMLPLAFRFEQTASLVGWKGEKSHRGYQSLVDAISALAGQPRPIKARREPKPQPQPEPKSQARRHPQVHPPPKSSAVPIPKWKIPVAAPAIPGKWTIAAAASAMVVGIGILAFMKPSPLPVSPIDPAVHRAKVVIHDYGEHYQLYRGDDLLGTTPFEFEANVGERIQVECRSNGEHVQTLTFDVGNNNVWSCRE